jgi:hypothetical protein
MLASQINLDDRAQSGCKFSCAILQLRVQSDCLSILENSVDCRRARPVFTLIYVKSWNNEKPHTLAA